MKEIKNINSKEKEKKIEMYWNFPAGGVVAAQLT